MPTYIGGLGVLSGDYVKEAGDREFPIVGIGLFYSESHELNENSPEKNNGTIKGAYPRENGLSLAVDDKQNRILISLPIHDRVVWAQVWKWVEGNSSVYLLDTNIPENEQNDRQITARLYIPDKEMRLKQEMVLGIGGSRLLQALKIHPSVYHLNEGHSAFWHWSSLDTKWKGEMLILPKLVLSPPSISLLPITLSFPPAMNYLARTS